MNIQTFLNLVSGSLSLFIYTVLIPIVIHAFELYGLYLYIIKTLRAYGVPISKSKTKKFTWFSVSII